MLNLKTTSIMAKLYPVVIIPKKLEKLVDRKKIVPFTQTDQISRINKIGKKKKDDLAWLYGAFVIGYLGGIGFLLIVRVNPRVILILTISALVVIGCIGIYENLFNKDTPAPQYLRGNLKSTKSPNTGLTDNLKQFTAQLLLKPASQNRQNTTTGPSELLFEDTLKKHFAVKAGVPFNIPGSDKQYVADFIVVDTTTGISIDVEIDEPYIAAKERYGQPHHCIDSTLDDRRDQFFLNGNYIVIRFAEEQVIKYPLACCKIIAETLANITGNNAIATPFSDLNYPIPVRRWTTKESQIMAQKNYRQRYLSSASIFLTLQKYPNQKKSSRQNSRRKKKITNRLY